jgi:hypothetical protein
MMRRFLLSALIFAGCSTFLNAQQRLWYGGLQPLQDSSNLTLHLGNVYQELSTNTPLSAWSGTTNATAATVHAHFEYRNDLLHVQYRADDAVFSYSMGLYQRNSFHMDQGLFSILYGGVIDSVGANYGQQRTSSFRQSFYGERRFNEKLTAGVSFNLHARNSFNALNYTGGYIDTRKQAIDIAAEGSYIAYNTPGIDTTFSIVQQGIPLTQLEQPHISALAQPRWTPSLSFFVELKPTSFVRLRAQGENIAPRFYDNIRRDQIGYDMKQSAQEFSPGDFIEGEALESNYDYSTTRTSSSDTALVLYKHPASLGSSLEVDFSNRISFLAVNHFTWYPEYVRVRLQALAKTAFSEDQFLITGLQTTNTHGRLHTNLVFAGATKIHPQMLLVFSTETLLNAAYVQRGFGPAPLSRYQFQCSLQISIP